MCKYFNTKIQGIHISHFTYENAGASVVMLNDINSKLIVDTILL